MDALNFNSSWNGSKFHNKIHNKYFTSIRLENPEKFILNKSYVIEFKHQPVKIAKIIRLVSSTLPKLSELYFFLDCGYNKIDSLKLFATMYRFNSVQLENQLFYIMLFETVE